MSKFNFGPVLQSGATAKASGPSGPSVAVTQATLDQMAKHPGDAGLRQGVIIVRNPGDALPKVDGLVDVTVDGDTYRLSRRGKEFNLRVTGQSAETLDAFSKLFNKLSATPDKTYPVTFKAV